MRTLPPSGLPKPRFLSTQSSPITDCFDCVQHKLFGTRCSTHTATVSVALPEKSVELDVSRFLSGAETRDILSADKVIFSSATASDERRARWERYMREHGKRPTRVVVDSTVGTKCEELKKRCFPNVSLHPFEVTGANVGSKELELTVPAGKTSSSTFAEFSQFYSARDQYVDHIRNISLYFEYHSSPYHEQVEQILTHQNRLNFLRLFAHHFLYILPLESPHSIHRGMLIYVKPEHLDLFR